jgi:hypothetical protein
VALDKGSSQWLANCCSCLSSDLDPSSSLADDNTTQETDDPLVLPQNNPRYKAQRPSRQNKHPTLPFSSSKKTRAPNIHNQHDCDLGGQASILSRDFRPAEEAPLWPTFITLALLGLVKTPQSVDRSQSQTRLFPPSSTTSETPGHFPPFWPRYCRPPPTRIPNAIALALPQVGQTP